MSLSSVHLLRTDKATVSSSSVYLLPINKATVSSSSVHYNNSKLPTGKVTVSSSSVHVLSTSYPSSPSVQTDLFHQHHNYTSLEFFFKREKKEGVGVAVGGGA